MKPTVSPVSSSHVISLLCFLLLTSFLTSCVKRTRSVQMTLDERAKPVSASAQPLVNINSASRDELERLPGIGPALATRIIEHRERYGRFRRAEHLIMVRGLSDHRFRVLRSFAVVE